MGKKSRLVCLGSACLQSLPAGSSWDIARWTPYADSSGEASQGAVSAQSAELKHAETNAGRDCHPFMEKL